MARVPTLWSSLVVLVLPLLAGCPATTSGTASFVATLQEIGYEPVTPVFEATLDEGGSETFEVTLTGDTSCACDAALDLCDAGCYVFVAASGEPTLTELGLVVSPLTDPSDVIAENLSVGPGVQAGFCFGWKCDEAKEPEQLRVTITAKKGHGSVRMAGGKKLAE